MHLFHWQNVELKIIQKRGSNIVHASASEEETTQGIFRKMGSQKRQRHCVYFNHNQLIAKLVDRLIVRKIFVSGGPICCITVQIVCFCKRTSTILYDCFQLINQALIKKPHLAQVCWYSEIIETSSSILILPVLALLQYMTPWPKRSSCHTVDCSQLQDSTWCRRATTKP